VGEAREKSLVGKNCLEFQLRPRPGKRIQGKLVTKTESGWAHTTDGGEADVRQGLGGEVSPGGDPVFMKQKMIMPRKTTSGGSSGTYRRSCHGLGGPSVVFGEYMRGNNFLKSHKRARTLNRLK